MAGFSLQLKPVGSDCNLHCEYCYAEPFKTGHLVIMAHEVLERAISGCLLHNPNPSITWHGGEPTLAGLDFYQEAQEIIDHYRKPGQTVTQILQTNATLITPQLADFFAEHGFEIGISLDGPKEINDLNRQNLAGHGSFDQIITGLKTLRNSGLDPSVIATVDSNTLLYPREVFEFLIAQGFTRIKFSPVYDAGRDQFNVSNNEWFQYLSVVFDVWMGNGNPEISVSELDEVIAWLDPEAVYPMCSSNHTCINWVSIDPDGSMYPCSYFRADAYGNIMDIPLQEIAKAPGYQNFFRVFNAMPTECQKCKFLRVCSNGCSATRINREGQLDPTGRYVYCNERKRLYRRIKNAFVKEAQES